MQQGPLLCHRLHNADGRNSVLLEVCPVLSSTVNNICVSERVIVTKKGGGGGGHPHTESKESRKTTLSLNVIKHNRWARSLHKAQVMQAIVIAVRSHSLARSNERSVKLDEDYLLLEQSPSSPGCVSFHF